MFWSDLGATRLHSLGTCWGPEDDRDALRFLWVDDPFSEEPKIIVLRFARVAFGLSSSPFLLNVTLKHFFMVYK